MPDIKKMPNEYTENTPEASSIASVMLNYRKPLIILAHIAMFAASLVLSLLLANNMQIRRSWVVEQFPVLAVMFIPIKFVVFAIFKQYRGWWRYVGISDLTGILRASLLSTFIIVVLWWLVGIRVEFIRQSMPQLSNTAQSVFIIDMFATILMLAGLRILIRLYYEEFRTVEGV